MNNRHVRSWLTIAAAIATLAVMLSSCNAQKKNTAAARQYTAFITRYNIYYNGDTHFKETLHEMEKSYEDDYSRMVFMHPVEAKADEKLPQPQGDFTRSIEKAQKAIQLRSIKKKPKRKSGKGNDADYKAWLKREEYNPFIHNAWMMMGRSQYFNGDFLGAASTFFYISKHFGWLPETVTEAKLWQARSYLSLDWLYEAEIIITRIKEPELVSSDLKGLYNFVYADFKIRSKDYSGSVPYLTEAIRHSSGAQKTRLNFLLGQVYARVGDKENAYQAFKKAGGASGASYRTKFNARIKQSEVYTGENIEPEVKALKRMTRYDRNKEYLDQVYYAIGNLYLSHGDTARAIESYILAAEKSTRNGIDKAISQITLGGLYFLHRDYEKAQPCYAEALPQLPETYPDYALLKRRSDVLDELAVYSQNVNLQDSLLRLSDMSEDERLAVIGKIIDELKKKEKEEAEAAKREEYLANQAAMGNQLQGGSANAPATFNINADNSWYFYNTSTRNSGKTEFQKRWGSRKLEDDWRRRNKSSFNTGDFDPTDDNGDDDDVKDSNGSEEQTEQTEEEREKQEKSEDPHYPEYYLKQIPQTDEEKRNSHDIIQEGLYNMGVILKDKLEDYPASRAEFDRLLADYPDNIYRLDVYYNLYLMFMREGDRQQAEHYRSLILNDFSDSKYGLAMRDPDYLDNLKSMDKLQEELYERTYDDYLNNRNDEVHAAYNKMMEQYPLSKIMPKFMFLHALAYVTERKSDEFNAVLRDMLDRYPDTDITPVASSWLKGMAQGRQLQSASSGNIRGMLWDIRLTNDSIPLDSIGRANFELDPEDKQLLVLVFPTERISSNQLLYEVARHNFRSFVVKDFDLEQMNFGRLGMIIIKEFDNMNELDHYRKVMSGSQDFSLPAEVRPVTISVRNFDMLLKEGRTFDDYFRFLQEQDYIDAQAPLFDPDDIESLQEAETAVDVIPDENETEAVGGRDEAAPQPAVNTGQKTPGPENTNGPGVPVAPEEQKKTADRNMPAPSVKPARPSYEPGSEGDDDPLLEQ